MAKQTVNKKGASTRVRRKNQRTVPVGIVHVKATFNNTIVTVTDPAGNVISWSSAGRVNFKGSRKSGAFPANVAAQDATRQAMSFGVKEVEVRLKGPGAGREAAVRGVVSTGVVVTTIADETPVPHNGCRPPKRRRV